MTVEINVQCDGQRCNNSREIDEDRDDEIERLGWGIDTANRFHYCPDCWEKVKEEIGS